MLEVSCLGQTGLSACWWGLHRTVLSLSSLFFGKTNLWLLLAMVARDQVHNDTGPQGGNECAPVIGDFGLLPHHRLQQNDTKS